MGDYGFRSEVEPRISKSEQLILQEVVAKAENKLDEAIEYLEGKIVPKSSAALNFALGTMYYQRGRLSRSEASYKESLEKFPSFLRAYKNLGFVELSLGKFREASQHFSRSISLGEGDGVTYVALGYCHYSLQEFVSAERDKPVVIQVDQWADASILAKLVREAKKASPLVSLATLKTK